MKSSRACACACMDHSHSSLVCVGGEAKMGSQAVMDLSRRTSYLMQEKEDSLLI